MNRQQSEKIISSIKILNTDNGNLINLPKKEEKTESAFEVNDESLKKKDEF